MMGLGTDSVIPVKCDTVGRMDAADLDVQILQAKTKVCLYLSPTRTVVYSCELLGCGRDTLLLQ